MPPLRAPLTSPTQVFRRDLLSPRRSHSVPWSAECPGVRPTRALAIVRHQAPQRSLIWHIKVYRTNSYILMCLKTVSCAGKRQLNQLITFLDKGASVKDGVGGRVADTSLRMVRAKREADEAGKWTIV